MEPGPRQRTSGANRVRVDLTRELAVGDAVVLLGRELLDRLHAHADDLVADRDPESLHDFRVTVRRTRSLLTLARPVLPPDVRREARRGFAALGRATGPLRDLDVCLASETACRRRADPVHREAVAGIFARARVARAGRRRELEARLREPGFLGALPRWREVLDRLAQGKGDPVGPAADRLVRRTWRRVRRRGRRLAPASPDAALHRLRIAVKRHRYAVELLASLYPQATVEAHLSKVKGLHNLLGDHNDLAVQRTDLAALAAAAPAAVADAARDLDRRLARRQLLLRRRLAPACRDFTGPATRAVIDALTRRDDSGRPA